MAQGGRCMRGGKGLGVCSLLKAAQGPAACLWGVPYCRCVLLPYRLQYTWIIVCEVWSLS